MHKQDQDGRLVAVVESSCLCFHRQSAWASRVPYFVHLLVACVHIVACCAHTIEVSSCTLLNETLKHSWVHRFPGQTYF